MKKLILLSFLLLSNICGYAQKDITLTSHNLRQDLNFLFSQSNAGKKDDIKLKLQEIFAQSNLQPHPSAKPQPSAKKSAAQTNIYTTPWQVAIFLASDDANRLTEGLGVLKYQVTRGTLKHAVLLDIAPRGHSHQRKAAKLYFIHRQQGKTVMQQRAISTDILLEELLAALFSNLKAEGETLYTGIIFSAHGSGFGMAYNDSSVEVNDILASAHKQALHINVLELDSCHMSSLYTAYYASEYDNIDFLNGSSDYEYGTPEKTRLFPLLSFLNHEPKDAARLSVASRLKQFDFASGEYETTSYSTVHIPSLRQALIDWYRSYVFLQKSTDEQLVPVFNRFLKNDDTWRSLSFIVGKQKEYVATHFEELESNYNKFDLIKREFIDASDKLLQALSEATVIQWCYSAQKGRIYQGSSAGTADCMQSISTDRSQFKWLWEEQAEQLQEDWENKTRIFRIL